VLESDVNGLPLTTPTAASMPSQSGSARLEPSLSTSCFSWSKALASLAGSMLTGTPDASGNCIGLAVTFPFSG